MSGRRARPTFPERFAQIEEDLRLNRVRRKGHTESKTFLVGPPFDPATVYIPPFFVGIDHDGETPEWKRLSGFASVLRTGTCSISWLLNGVSVGSQSVSSTPAILDLDAAIDLAHGDTLRPSVTGGSSPVGLAAAAFIVTAVR